MREERLKHPSWATSSNRWQSSRRKTLQLRSIWFTNVWTTTTIGMFSIKPILPSPKLWNNIWFNNFELIAIAATSTTITHTGRFTTNVSIIIGFAECFTQSAPSFVVRSTNWTNAKSNDTRIWATHDRISETFANTQRKYT